MLTSDLFSGDTDGNKIDLDGNKKGTRTIETGNMGIT